MPDQVIRDAIRRRASLTATYERYVRFFSPHVLGKDSSGAQFLVDAMNAIWIPQANVVFTLESFAKAVIKGLAPQATGVDITNAAIVKELVAVKGSNK